MDTVDRTFEAFKKLVPYSRGALWWAKDERIKQSHPDFVKRDDRIGHPLLSVSKKPVKRRFDVVPMLVGTSRACCNQIVVTGITREDPSHKTYFGSIIQPGWYEFNELMEGVLPRATTFEEKDRYLVKKRNDERATVRIESHFASRVMYPNWDKLRVSSLELDSLNRWLHDKKLED